MSRNSLRVLYAELARGRLERYLDGHPELLNLDTAQAVTAEFDQAVEFADLPAAVAAVRTAAAILVRIDNPQMAIALQLKLFDLQLNAAGSSQDYAALRTWALTAGVRAQDSNWAVGQAECLLVAAECARRMSDPRHPEGDRSHLVTALRDLADVADLIAGHPPAPRWTDSITRFAHLVGMCSDAAFRTQWDEWDLLPLRALLRRCAHQAQRVVPREFAKGIYERPGDEAAAMDRLTRLVMQFAD